MPTFQLGLAEEVEEDTDSSYINLEKNGENPFQSSNGKLHWGRIINVNYVKFQNGLTKWQSILKLLKDNDGS